MMLITKLNYKTVTAFCENVKVVSSDFSVIKNIVAPLSLSSLPPKLICCSNQDFLIQFAYSNLLQLVCNALENINSLIKYVLCSHYFFLFQ